MSAATFMCVGTVWAQDDAAAGPVWVPVETFACNFNDGKSMADLMAVVQEWNAWMDEQGVDDYFASVVTPQFFGEYKMDVGWLGAWKDGNAMGAGLNMWTSEGDEMNAKFFEVLSCAAHTNFASTLLKPPTYDDSDNTGVLEISNCSVNSSKTYDEVMAALNDSAVKQRLNDEVEAAIGKGVFGSPFVIVDGEPFWGVDRFDMIDKWLETGGW